MTAESLLRHPTGWANGGESFLELMGLEDQVCLENSKPRGGLRLPIQSRTKKIILRNFDCNKHLPNNDLIDGRFGGLFFFFNSAASECAFKGQ